MAEKSLSVKATEEGIVFERSPFIRGLLSGAKGALLGAAAGAAVQAVRGKSLIPGAVLGAIGTAIMAGAARSATQDLENQETEAKLRYHAERIKTREPYFFMPKRDTLLPLIRRLQAQGRAGSTDDLYQG